MQLCKSNEFWDPKDRNSTKISPRGGTLIALSTMHLCKVAQSQTSQFDPTCSADLSRNLHGGKGRSSCKGWKGSYIDAAKDYWIAPAKPDEVWSKGFRPRKLDSVVLVTRCRVESI